MIYTEYPKDDIENVLTLVDAMEGALRDLAKWNPALMTYGADAPEGVRAVVRKLETAYEIRELERPSENRVKILTGAGWIAAWDENGDRAEEAYAKGARIAGTIQTDKKGRKKIVGVEVVA